MTSPPFLALIECLRPKQWTKNGFAFAAILFAKQLGDPVALANAFIAFATLCLGASACYLVNDIADAERDRKHPDKSGRPIASGRLSPRAAGISAIILMVAAVSISLFANINLALCISIYIVLTLAYTFWLKHIVIMDVLAIAFGFVLRAVAGAVAIKVEISPWLLLCTLLLALFMAIAKRRGELQMLEMAEDHREILGEYSEYLLDQMTSVVTSAALMAYCLYTFSERTLDVVGGANLKYTIPFVVYGIFRYLYLVHKRGLGADPSHLLISDKPLLATVVLWAIVSGIVLYVPS
ncbi:MAG TPA: decaprenyl-phosphate phosphoribosyltransferase [Armatimonadota bacterium]|nr:decaprenyl-phosphate phosphoribosyltransferase [Armatimonadota bacterium]